MSKGRRPAYAERIDYNKKEMVDRLRPILLRWLRERHSHAIGKPRGTDR